MKSSNLLLFAVAVGLSGCSRTVAPTPEGMPDVGLEADALNAQVHVWAPAEVNTFKVNEPIALAVEVIGDDQIAFQRDFGNRTFQYMNREWSEVQYVPTDWGQGIFLLAPSNGDPRAWGSTEVFPWFDEPPSEVYLRIFVVGLIYRNGEVTDSKAGAFVDVILQD